MKEIIQVACNSVIAVSAMYKRESLRCCIKIYPAKFLSCYKKNYRSAKYVKFRLE